MKAWAVLYGTSAPPVALDTIAAVFLGRVGAAESVQRATLLCVPLIDDEVLFAYTVRLMQEVAHAAPGGADLTVRLDKFNKKIGLDRGKPFWFEALWYMVKCTFFLSSLPWPTRLKRWLLVRFGAVVGRGLVLRPRVDVHMPWKLVIGDHCWIGDDCGFLNLEPIVIQDHVAIAHRVYFATGNHDWEDHTMPYRNAPITIERGTWVASCAVIGPGVTVGEHCVITAGSVVTKSVPPWSIVRGNPARVVKSRVLKR